MSDLISRSDLLNEFNEKNIQITFDLPVEEVIGEDVDLDDFAMLVQDAIQAYKKIVIDTIKNMPAAYDVDKVVAQLEEWTFNADVNIGDGTMMNHNLIVSKNAIEIVKGGGVNV